MPRESADPYAVLGLPPTATQDQITNAYRRQVRTLHPDVRTTSQPARPPSDEQLRRVLGRLFTAARPRAPGTIRPRSHAPPHRPAGTGGNDKHSEYRCYRAHPRLDR